MQADGARRDCATVVEMDEDALATLFAELSAADRAALAGALEDADRAQVDATGEGGGVEGDR